MRVKVRVRVRVRVRVGMSVRVRVTSSVMEMSLDFTPSYYAKDVKDAIRSDPIRYGTIR